MMMNHDEQENQKRILFLSDDNYFSYYTHAKSRESTRLPFRSVFILNNTFLISSNFCYFTPPPACISNRCVICALMMISFSIFKHNMRVLWLFKAKASSFKCIQSQSHIVPVRQQRQILYILMFFEMLNIKWGSSFIHRTLEGDLGDVLSTFLH